MPNSLLSRTSIRMLACAALVATAPLLGAAAQAQSDATKPVAVVAVNGYNDLIADIDYLGQFGNQVGAGQQLDSMLLFFTQNKGLQGIDKDKSWGVIVGFGGPVVCLPVTDLDAVFGLIENFGMTTSEMADGITEIEIPNQSVYVKKAGNWAFAASSPEMLADAPADPGDMFDKMTADYDVAARLMVQNVPEIHRMAAIEQLRLGAEQGTRQLPGESDEAFEARKESLNASIDQITQMVNDLNELSVGFKTGADEEGVILDFTYDAVPGSQLARGIAAYQNSQTMFGGCMKDGAAVEFNVSVTSPPDLVAESKAQIESQINALRQQASNGVDRKLDGLSEEARQTMKEAVNELLDAFQATAMSGKMDVAGSVDIQDGKVTVVAGGYTKDSAKVESALKKMAAVAKDGPAIQWNADSHAGANIHTFQAPVTEPDEQAILGETIDMAVAVGKDQIYFSAGYDNVAAMKQAMDSSGSSATPVKPMQFSVALTPILQLAAELGGNPVLDSVLNAVITKSEGLDSVNMTAENTDGKLRTRIELEKGVLQAIGAAALEAQRQGAGAGF